MTNFFSKVSLFFFSLLPKRITSIEYIIYSLYRLGETKKKGLQYTTYNDSASVSSYLLYSSRKGGDKGPDQKKKKKIPVCAKKEICEFEFKPPHWFPRLSVIGS